MKKIFALLLALCLAISVSAAFADVLVSEGTPIAFDGFSLNLSKDTAYEAGEKVKDQVYFIVYPYYMSTGDSSTNFNAVWAGETEEITVRQLQNQLPSIRKEIEEGFKEYNITLDALVYEDPFESTLGGEFCLVLNAEMTISSNGTAFGMLQRQFYVGSKGYVFTVTGLDRETLDAASTMLDYVLAWD